MVWKRELFVKKLQNNACISYVSMVFYFGLKRAVLCRAHAKERECALNERHERL